MPLHAFRPNQRISLGVTEAPDVRDVRAAESQESDVAPLIEPHQEDAAD